VDRLGRTAAPKGSAVEEDYEEGGERLEAEEGQEATGAASGVATMRSKRTTGALATAAAVVVAGAWLRLQIAQECEPSSRTW
jgi:hypothetical protein